MEWIVLYDWYIDIFLFVGSEVENCLKLCRVAVCKFEISIECPVGSQSCVESEGMVYWNNAGSTSRLADWVPHWICWKRHVDVFQMNMQEQTICVNEQSIRNFSFFFYMNGMLVWEGFERNTLRRERNGCRWEQSGSGMISFV